MGNSKLQNNYCHAEFSSASFICCIYTCEINNNKTYHKIDSEIMPLADPLEADKFRMTHSEVLEKGEETGELILFYCATSVKILYSLIV